MAKAKRIKRALTALTAERARECLRYDPVSGALYWRITVRRRDGHVMHRPGQRADHGVRGRDRYRRVTVDGVRYMAHRVIWLMRKGHLPSKGEVDHGDRNGHNNRWSNLRDATRSEQNFNTRTRKNNKAGLKWVRTKGPGKFQAAVALTLGTYRTARKAHQVARDFVRGHHGEFFNAGN